jgi:hypothetical protein
MASQSQMSKGDMIDHLKKLSYPDYDEECFDEDNFPGPPYYVHCPTTIEHAIDFLKKYQPDYNNGCIIIPTRVLTNLIAKFFQKKKGLAKNTFDFIKLGKYDVQLETQWITIKKVVDLNPEHDFQPRVSIIIDSDRTVKIIDRWCVSIYGDKYEKNETEVNLRIPPAAVFFSSELKSKQSDYIPHEAIDVMYSSEDFIHIKSCKFSIIPQLKHFIDINGVAKIKTIFKVLQCVYKRDNARFESNFYSKWFTESSDAEN